MRRRSPSASRATAPGWTPTGTGWPASPSDASAPRDRVECRLGAVRRQRAVAQLGSALDWGSRGRRFKSCQPDRCLALSKAHWSRMDAPRISIASLSLLLVPLEGGQVRSTNTLSQSCVIHRPLGVSVASHRAGLGQAPGRVFRASFVDGARICAIRRFGLVCARRRHRCHLRVALAFMAIGGPVQL